MIISTILYLPLFFFGAKGYFRTFWIISGCEENFGNPTAAADDFNERIIEALDDRRL